MKVTYLIRKKQSDGTFEMECGTKQELHEIMEANKGLPLEQRRLFIKDYIVDGGEIDCMIMEVPLEMYRNFNREHMASERNRQISKKYSQISLEAVVSDEEDITIGDMLSDGNLVDDAVLSSIQREELIKTLSAWKPWATDMLNFYMSGQKRSCTRYLAEKYGVSEQVIRKYKRQFEIYIRNFFSDVSI